MTTARILGLDRDEQDGVLLIRARCENCHKTVYHGGGQNLDDVLLGHRVAHCGCGGYELIDPAGIVAARVSVIRAELGERAARRAASRTRRACTASQ